MKSIIRLLFTAASLGAAASAAAAPDRPLPPPKEKREMRVLAGPDGPERHMRVPREGDKPFEKETVAFLGVETAPVSATLGTQLGLARGTGLVVEHVIPKSPADGTLQQHDILLKLDDQILIETRQLAVLIRNRKGGDEVTLTYLRGGKETTARIKLGQHEVPKLGAGMGPAARAFAFAPGDMRHFDTVVPAPFREGEREHVDRVLSLIQRAPQGAHPPIRIDRREGAGIRAMSINTANSNLVFSDDAGSLELTVKDGVKSLVAKNAKGDVLFSGPVTTPDERKAMPAPVRERLEKLEGMQNITFHTDGDFKGAEVKIVRPLGRGISLPYQPAPAPEPARRPFF